MYLFIHPSSCLPLEHQVFLAEVDDYDANLSTICRIEENLNYPFEA